MSDMPPNPPPGPPLEPELEARIVAWVLGDASAFEASELQRLVDEKPELAAFKRQIESVHGVVGEATGPDWKPLRLSPERRRKLLAATEVAGASETSNAPRLAVLPQARFRWGTPKFQRRFIEVAAVLLIVGTLVSLSVSSLGTAFSSSKAQVAEEEKRSKAMEGLQVALGQLERSGAPTAAPAANNIRQIQAGADQYFLQNGTTADRPVAAPQTRSDAENLVDDSPFISRDGAAGTSLRGGSSYASTGNGVTDTGQVGGGVPGRGGRRGGGGGGGGAGGGGRRAGGSGVGTGRGASNGLEFGGLLSNGPTDVASGLGAGGVMKGSADESNSLGFADAAIPPTAQQNLAAANAEARGLSARIAQQLGGSATHDLAGDGDVPTTRPAPLRGMQFNFGVGRRFGDSDMSDTGAATAATGATVPAPAPIPPPPPTAAPAGEFDQILNFSNDDRTNSIVATGNVQDLKALAQMNASNTYAGPTTLSGGTLAVQNGVVINGGTLDASGTGAIAFNHGGGILGEVAPVTTGSFTAGSQLAGIGGVSAPTAYSGSTTILQGSLSTGASGVFANGGSASSIGASSNAASNLVLNGGALSYTGNNAFSTDRLFQTRAGGTISGTNTGQNAFTGGITVNGGNHSIDAGLNLAGGGQTNNAATNVTKLGSGTWELDGTSNFTGNMNITAGTVSLGDLRGTGTLTVSGGTPDLGNRTVAAGLPNATSAAAGIDTNGGTVTFRDALVGAGGASRQRAEDDLVKSGQTVYPGQITNNGSFTFLGSNALTVNGGSLTVGGSNAFSNTAPSVEGAVMIPGTPATPVTSTSGLKVGMVVTGAGVPAGSGDIHLLDAHANQDVGGGWTIGAAAPVDASHRRWTGVFGNPVGDDNETAYAAGAGLVTQAGTAADKDGKNVPDFLLGGGGGTLTVSSSFLTTGSISGSGSFTKIGNGMQTLSGANTYTGPTAVNGGTLVVGGGLIGDGGNGFDLTKTGAGTLELAGNSTYTGGTILNSGTLVITQNQGKELKVAPTVEDDNYSISLDLNPRAKEADGFVENTGQKAVATNEKPRQGGTALADSFQPAPLVTLSSSSTVLNGLPAGSGQNGRLAYAVPDEGVKAKVNAGLGATASDAPTEIIPTTLTPPVLPGQPNLATSGFVLGSYKHNPPSADDRLNIDDAMVKFDSSNQPVDGSVNLGDVPAGQAERNRVLMDALTADAEVVGASTQAAAQSSTTLGLLANLLPDVNGQSQQAQQAAGLPQSIANPVQKNTLESKEYFPITAATQSRLAGAAGTKDASSNAAQAAAVKAFFQNAGVDFSGVNGADLAYDGSSLVINQTPKNIDKVRNLLARYNDIKQVQIETKFIEVQEDKLNEAGVNWNVARSNGPAAAAAAKPAANSSPAGASQTPGYAKSYTLSNANAADVANAINTLVQGPLQPMAGAAPSVVAVDPRNNELVFQGPDVAVPLFDQLAASLDQPLPPNPDQAAVRLKNATSSVVVQELHNIIAGHQAEQQAKTRAKIDPAAAARKAALAAIADAEVKTADEAFSTFSLHVSDVSFKLAQDALAKGQKPDPAAIRPEEFYNAFDYGDPSPAKGEPVACRIEQAAHPVLQQRNLVRIALRVPATGRDAAQPLRLTVLLDTSGSMERADRAACVHAAMASLAGLLGPKDLVTLIGFSRTPRLLVQRLPGNQASQLVTLTAHLPFQGGTNLEEALKLAGEQARAMQSPGAQNRIVLLTDGAANLGDADPEQLGQQIATLRQQGITLDACGVVAGGLDDGVLEALTRKGDGRYYLLNAPEDADAAFAKQLAGAFHPAAENIKVQVQFNPARVASYRLIGFEANRLKTEDFHNDAVTAAQLAAEEAAVALYQVEVRPDGDGELGDVSVRFRESATGQMVERTWTILHDPAAKPFDQASPTLQLAGTAAMMAEKLRGGAVASLFRLDALAPTVNALRGHYAREQRVQDLSTMYNQMRRMFGE